MATQPEDFVGRDEQATRPDAEWNRRVRGETPTERLDRNWGHLLQELRVVQTGIQILTGLLLTLPFQPGFTKLDHAMRVVYLITVAASIGATTCLVAPVSWHRLLFRRHQLRELVAVAHRCATAGLVLFGAALTGVGVLIFNAVAGSLAGQLAGAVSALVFIIGWAVAPWIVARTAGSPGAGDQQPDPADDGHGPR